MQHVGGGEILNGPDAAGFTGTFMGKAVFETNLAVAASAMAGRREKRMWSE